MTDITEKIINLLRENGIDKAHTLDTLSSVYSEIEFSMWETIKLNAGVFYGLKDLVFYNLEHLASNGEDRGLSNLRFIGTIFPNFIYSFNDVDFIKNDELPALLAEINLITSKWDKSWRMANIYTNTPTSWQGGDNPSKVIFHERGESPTKYVSNAVSRTSRILGPNGSNLRRDAESYVYCVIDEEIGEYGQGPILYGVMIQLREAVNKAIVNGKDLKLELEG